MKILITLLLTLMGTACTSAPQTVHYYLLHTPSLQQTDNSHSGKPTVALKTIVVADYLRQSSLVLQLNQHELYYSRQDVWAESLQSSFTKALLQDLNHSTPLSYISALAPSGPISDQVSIKLEHFHITHNASVVASGHYWLTNNDSPLASSFSKTFFFERPLQEDGYEHAVQQLRKLVTALAQQLGQDVANMPSQ
jgi:uncharacterized lipoprotein YmbA